MSADIQWTPGDDQTTRGLHVPLYLDTSLVVAALTNESASGRVQNWLDEQAAESLTISDWVATEFSAALSSKLRKNDITIAERASALAMFTRLCADSFAVLPVSRAQYRRAAQMADQHTTGLRAGDALHLAVCADHGATLCTLDKDLSEAGAILGVPLTIDTQLRAEVLSS